MNTEHFISTYSEKDDDGEGSYSINAATAQGCYTYPGTIWVFVDKNEITQGCINRIVDNLNKLAEYKSKQDVIS